MPPFRFAVAAAYLAFTTTCSHALDNGFTRPPLGWSALYGAPFSQVTEAIVRAASQGLVDGGFARAGYAYVIIDDWWAERGPDGKMRGTNATFPSGIPATSAFVHNLGLKWGVYSAASQRTCANYSASQWLESLDAETFAHEWSIDWLKYDSCLYNNGVTSRAKYTAMRDALNATGRQIFYSMEGQAYWPDIGNMWRTGGDIFPQWDAMVLRNLYANNALASLFLPGKGAFNDPDMLQLGSNGLPFEEARSQFVLWAVMKAPLILGTHWSELATMRVTDPDTFDFATNAELLALNQDISPAATMLLSMPSAAQAVAGVNVTLQPCDATRGEQQWLPGATAGAVVSKHGSLCLSGAATGGVTAAPCDGTAAQSWGGLRANSQLSVAAAGAVAGACLDDTNGVLALKPCAFTGALPPPLDASFGAQVFVWDSKGSVIGGSSELCVTLGLPNYVAGRQYVTNNGTLALEVWGGPLSSGKTVAVLFNKGGASAETITANWDVFGLPRGASLPVRDVLARAALPPASELKAIVPPHGVRAFVVG